MNDDHDNAIADKAILEKLTRPAKRARRKRDPDDGRERVKCCGCGRVHRLRERVYVPLDDATTESRCPKCNKPAYIYAEKGD